MSKKGKYSNPLANVNFYNVIFYNGMIFFSLRGTSTTWKFQFFIECQNTFGSIEILQVAQKWLSVSRLSKNAGTHDGKYYKNYWKCHIYCSLIKYFTYFSYTNLEFLSFYVKNLDFLSLQSIFSQFLYAHGMLPYKLESVPRYLKH